ncbi:single tm domain protein [Entamoeba histolytica]|uniref:Single tm domain protein n=1 Tax=Entamoeba histolytica TaxID=5759 RepID=A0A175JCX5_ENTHI|nr:single tm domain protein [Entamoeba histolytica]
MDLLLTNTEYIIVEEKPFVMKNPCLELMFFVSLGLALVAVPYYFYLTHSNCFR